MMYVTRFGKMCIVHTSDHDFAHLEIHKNHRKWYTDVKLLGIIKEYLVVLQSLNISHLSIIPNRYYETPKLKNWMCELCTFSNP